MRFVCRYFMIGFIAINFSPLSVVAAACKRGPSQCERMLVKHAQEGDLLSVQAFVERGVLPDARDRMGATGMHHAASDNNIPMLTFFLLDEHQLSPDLLDLGNQTPLHWGAIAGSTEAVRILIEKKANVNLQDKSGFAPLHLAKNAQIVYALHGAGARIDTIDQKKRTPLHWASEKGNEEVAEALLLLGAPVNLRSSLRDGYKKPASLATEKEVQQLLKKYGPATKELLDAIDKKNVQMARAALKKGARIPVVDGEGNTPLHKAAIKDDPMMIVLLLSHGALPDAKNHAGRTPIEEAFERKAMKAVEAFSKAAYS